MVDFPIFMLFMSALPFRIPDNLSLEGVGPLLCAGITVFSPVKYFGLDKSGMHLGVVGLGGLGHLAVKFAKAFGMKVTVISTSPSKQKEAIEQLKADSFIVSQNMKQMEVRDISIQLRFLCNQTFHMLVNYELTNDYNNLFIN